MILIAAKRVRPNTGLIASWSIVDMIATDMMFNYPELLTELQRVSIVL
jgi:hypothetical protein